MAEPTEVVIHGRCACGKRYRIRNARQDTVVQCPACRRPIVLTDADMRAAAADTSLLPLQADETRPVPAVLIDDPHLRPASAGSTPGLTGHQVHTHEEAQLADALQPGPRLGVGLVIDAHESATAVAARPTGRFLKDLVASLYLVGKRRNLLGLAAAALGWSVPLLVLQLASNVFANRLGVIFALAMFVWTVLIFLHAVQYFWRTMTDTATGDDDVPLVPSDYDFIDDALRPLAWIAVVTAACALPGWLTFQYLPAGPNRVPLICAALALGSFLWPVAIMSVALGESLMFLRPDLLIRCILGIGPAYLIAWAIMMATLAGIGALLVLDPTILWPTAARVAYFLCSTFALIYLNYNLFRALGLLFRHFRHRFPWRY